MFSIVYYMKGQNKDLEDNKAKGMILMKKTIIAVMAAATVMVSMGAVFASEWNPNCPYGNEVCTVENCPNNGVRRLDGTGAKRRGGCRGNYEGCRNGGQCRR